MNMSRKNKRIVIVAALVVALGAVIFFSINARRTDQIAVQIEKATVRDKLVAKVSATGEIKPKEYVDLQSEIAGVITGIYVKEGDVVQKGDLLLRIDPIQTETENRAQQSALDIARSDATNQLAQITLQETNLQRDRASVAVAQAELDRSEKAYELAKDSFTRKQDLFEQNLISRDLYDQAKNELVTAETTVITNKARLEQAKAQLQVSQVVVEQARNSYKSAQHRVAQTAALLARTQDMLSKTVIRSPLTGVITLLKVELGERAVPGTLDNPSATLMEIADLSVIEAEVQVDETDIVEVKIGQPAEVKVDALPDQILKGTVTEVGNSAIAQLGTTQEAKDFKVVVQLDDPPKSLRPGLSCTADITTATREDALVIPIQALAIREFEVDDKGKMIKPPAAKDKKKGAVTAEASDKKKKREKKEFQGVFVVNNDKAEFVEVKTGISGDTEIEVLSGLKDGQDIVAGSFKTLRTLKDGDAVKKEVEKKG
jgi:HlyD family secretion protein